MSSREDIIEVPIEIRISDLAELNKLIQQLEEAKGKVDTARTSRRTMPSGGSGAPVQRSGESPVGIFRESEGDVLPIKPRDVSSRQAHTRERVFDDMNKRLDSLETVSAEAGSVILQLAANVGINVPFLAQGMRGVTIGKNFAKSIPPKSPITPPNMQARGGVVGGLIKLGKAIPFVGGAIFAMEGMYEIIKTMIDAQFAAGGQFDIRFKRNFKKESNILTSLQEKKEIRSGRRVIRVSTRAGLRGASQQQFSNLDLLKHGIAPYDMLGAADSRGII